MLDFEKIMDYIWQTVNHVKLKYWVFQDYHKGVMYFVKCSGIFPGYIASHPENSQLT